MKQIKGVKLKKVIVGVIFALMLALYPSAASAHPTRQFNGNDEGAVYSGHQSGYVFDREADGHRVWLMLWLRNGNIVFKYDSDGANNGTSYWSTGSDVVFSRLCEGDGNGGTSHCSSAIEH